MRTCSSRLFLIILHLVQVSTDFGATTLQHPSAIVLQRIKLPREGLTAINQQPSELITPQEHYLTDPIWLQDTRDGRCLSPTGFADCGETTLWYIRDISHLQSLKGESHRYRRWSRRTRLQLHGYAIEYMEPGSSGDCILVPKKEKRRRSRLALPTTEFSLSLGKCQSWEDNHVARWTIDGRGIVYALPDEDSIPRLATQPSAACVWRTNETGVLIAPCAPAKEVTTNGGPYTTTDGNRTVAQISMIRYVTATIAEERTNRMRQAMEAVTLAKEVVVVPTVEQEIVEYDFSDEGIIPNPPLSKPVLRFADLAHRHASEPIHHTQIKTKAIKTNFAISTSTPKAKKEKKHTLFNLQDTNPILFIGTQPRDPSTFNTQRTTAKSVPSTGSHAYKLLRLQTHPYFSTAKNNVWTDPQTGLEYPTDLCTYLGHDVKRDGRHTLTGVGYYMKTVLNIKIYGVALYISKKDALADGVMERYAVNNAEELRLSPEFYHHLREMPSPMDPNAGFIDRTLLLKLNMQLSMETMQSSLRATWKLLTEEGKNLLINSSMKSRPAEERMLQTIQSSGNPGRCSCGQVAPPEYNADPQCCARGTELVFTWRKNGNLEIRVDGRVMDIFPRPDVARGIFFEYLRTDDPISPDFINRVVDGFPFLLGPLAQVKGMPAAMHHQEAMRRNDRGLGKVMSNLGDTVATHAGEVGRYIQNGATEVVTHASNAAKSLGAATNSVKQGLERRRDQLWDQVSSLPDLGIQIMQKKLQNSRRHDELAESVAHYLSRQQRGEIQMIRRSLLTKSAEYDFRELSDVISLLQNNSSQRKNIFEGNLYLVHLYLLLLLIVSLPPRAHFAKVFHYHSKRLEESSLDDDASTGSSSSDESPAVENPFSFYDHWAIGCESVVTNQKSSRSRLVSIFKKQRRNKREW